ncbi:MAG: response regulator [Chloroflexota bacterium]
MAEKILIVDDDMDTLRLVGLMLQRQGFEIIAANTGSRALEVVKKELPDLILLDIMMPDMDGYEVTRQIREDESTTSIPIIMFTAKTQVDDKVLGFEVGADDYLTKPTHPQELIAHVKALLSRREKVISKAAVVRERGLVTGIMGAKGGLGVSTLALNLAISVRQKTQEDVVIADFRPGQGFISMMMGYTRPAGLNNLLIKNNEKVTLRDVENELVIHTTGVRMLLASPRPIDAQYIENTARFAEIADQLAKIGRYIIIDLGPSLTPMTNMVLEQCDNLIVITEPIPFTVNQTKDLLEDLQAKGIGRGRVNVTLVNRIRSSAQLSWGQVQEQLGVKITTVFTPAPELAYQAETANTPMVLLEPDGLTAQQFSQLTNFIVKQPTRITQ